jgi:hypothetical protein
MPAWRWLDPTLDGVDHSAVPRVRPYLRPWVESSRAGEYLRSAIALFALSSRDPTEEHRTQLLNNAVWYASEAAGKYMTRYRSAGVLGLEAEAEIRKWWSGLRHDHVTTRRSILEQLRRPGPDVEAVLRSVISCVVTADEHERLGRVDETHEGWDRYRAAHVDVYDMATGDPFIKNGQFV